MLTTVAVSGYRSLRDVVVPLAPLTVVSGANGVGKSNLYRGLRLLASAGRGSLIADVARSGGLAALRWAGPEQPSRAMRRGEVPVTGTRRREPVRLLLGVASEELGYAVDLGLPQPDGTSRFPNDPEIKAEAVFAGTHPRPASVLLERTGPRVRQRGAGGGRGWDTLAAPISADRSILAELVDPRTTPEVVGVRRMLESWRFYDALRADPEAPARRPQVATRPWALADDGADLAPALATIVEQGYGRDLDDAVADGLDSRVEVRETAVGEQGAVGVMDVLLHQPGLLRPVSGPELSEGTLRYLLLCAALLAPRMPELLVVNEPETSLHSRLLPALAQLIAGAARRTQVLVVTHAEPLAAALAEVGAARVELTKELGETVVPGRGPFDAPAWVWPSR
ncbi:MAG: ATP-binding protein [Micrococcales bacterium 73-15]|uniref:AAA family ATPase n=1 Tax=Salana multivorans TaxID=120377 RepID=UPI000962FED0|nr:AAA family ATPase [Salana multivorans]OJX94219.1 MAG: ATP-binding protein [Micrococcales bacterium 73-15]